MLGDRESLTRLVGTAITVVMRAAISIHSGTSFNGGNLLKVCRLRDFRSFFDLGVFSFLVLCFGKAAYLCIVDQETWES